MSDLISRQVVKDTNVPINDCISRQAAIAEFKHYAWYDSNRTNAEWVRRIELVLESLPTVDPVKHGKWINEETCSVCGESVLYDTDLFNYCPYCGAKMERSEE